MYNPQMIQKNIENLMLPTQYGPSKDAFVQPDKSYADQRIYFQVFESKDIGQWSGIARVIDSLRMRMDDIKFR